jgi:hypothetical protein
VTEAREFEARTPGASTTFCANNAYKPEELDECFERNSEGMLKNMAVHELGASRVSAVGEGSARARHAALGSESPVIPAALPPPPHPLSAFGHVLRREARDD